MWGGTAVVNVICSSRVMRHEHVPCNASPAMAIHTHWSLTGMVTPGGTSHLHIGWSLHTILAAARTGL